MKKNEKNDVWKKINKGEVNECWPYLGSTFSGKYGRFFWDGKAHLAHRIVYEQLIGEIPDGAFVMHKCNNKICCNPAHLTVGSNKDNQLHAAYSGAWLLGSSGIRGVSFLKKRGYWRAQCYENGRCRNLYTGPHKDKAVKVRKEWENENYINFKEGEEK